MGGEGGEEEGEEGGEGGEERCKIKVTDKEKVMRVDVRDNFG